MVVAMNPIKSLATWKKPDFVDNILAAKLRSGSISLVVGAGVSAGFNLPGWDELVEDIRAAVGEPKPTTPLSATDFSDNIFRKHFPGNRIAFAEHVRNVLYKNIGVDSSKILTSPLLQAIGSFLVSSMRGRAGALISFNFDDLIETYLRLLGFVVRSESQAPYWTMNADMQVFHPHGMLPFDRTKKVTPIVFTSSDFVEVIGKDDHPWNQSMMATLVGTMPIFIGLSGADMRLRSLLSNVKKIHPACIANVSPFWGVRPTIAGEDKTNVDRWTEQGIAPRQLANYDELAGWLLGICQIAASTQDAANI